MTITLTGTTPALDSRVVGTALQAVNDATLRTARTDTAPGSALDAMRVSLSGPIGKAAQAARRLRGKCGALASNHAFGSAAVALIEATGLTGAALNAALSTNEYTVEVHIIPTALGSKRGYVRVELTAAAAA